METNLPQENLTATNPENLSSDNDFGANLESVANDIINKIKHCDSQVEAWQNRKKEYQTKLNEILERIQKIFWDQKKVHRVKTDSTAPELIRVFLEKHGPSRTTDIKQFLLEHGKKTNPGVALGRMVQNKSIVHIERGVYKLAQ